MDIFDLDAVTPLDTATVTVKGPTGQPTTWVWTIAGPGHPATIAANEAAYQASVLRQRTRQQLIQEAVDAGKQPPMPIDSLEDVQSYRVQEIAPRVLGWGPARINGTDLPYSPQAVRDLLSDPRYVWLYNWLAGRLGALDSFLPPPAVPSGDTPNGNSLSDGGTNTADATATA